MFAGMPSSDDKTVGLALVTYQSAEDLPGFLETEAPSDPVNGR